VPHEIRSNAGAVALDVNVDAAAVTNAVAIVILIEYIYYIIIYCCIYWQQPRGKRLRHMSSCAEKRVQRLLLRRRQR
jgi:hypothetical protein